MEKPGATSETGMTMGDVVLRLMGDHPQPSQWKEGFVKSESFHQLSSISLWSLS